MTDDLFAPLTPANPGAPARRRCRPHVWLSTAENDSHCIRCHQPRDLVKARRSRNNGKRGRAEELTVAREVGGRKVGPLGHAWDVEVEGYMRLQVKKLAKWPSLVSVMQWLYAIPPSREMRGVALIEAPGMGRRARRLLVLDLDEFSEHHGELPGTKP